MLVDVVAVQGDISVKHEQSKTAQFGVRNALILVITLAIIGWSQIHSPSYGLDPVPYPLSSGIAVGVVIVAGLALIMIVLTAQRYRSGGFDASHILTISSQVLSKAISDDLAHINVTQHEPTLKNFLPGSARKD